MRASICSDQISGDLATALEFISDCNVREFELRTLGFDPFMSADPRALEAVEKAVHLKRFKLNQLSTSLFLEAGKLPSDDEIGMLFKFAERFNCHCISIFGGNSDDVEVVVAEVNEDEDDDVESRDDDDDDVDEDYEDADDEPVVNAMRAFIERAQRAKLQIVLRTHQDSAAATAEEALALLKKLALPELKLDWDVVECFAAGDDGGLNALDDVLPHLHTVHFADAVRRGISAEPATLGKGVIPWEEILEQLHEGGFRGPVIVDHRLPTKLKESKHALTKLACWIDAARMKKRGPDEREEPFPGYRKR